MRGGEGLQSICEEIEPPPPAKRGRLARAVSPGEHRAPLGRAQARIARRAGRAAGACVPSVRSERARQAPGRRRARSSLTSTPAALLSSPLSYLGDRLLERVRLRAPLLDDLLAGGEGRHGGVFDVGEVAVDGKGRESVSGEPIGGEPGMELGARPGNGRLCMRAPRRANPLQLAVAGVGGQARRPGGAPRRRLERAAPAASEKSELLSLSLRARQGAIGPALRCVGARAVYSGGHARGWAGAARRGRRAGAEDGTHLKETKE